MTQPQDKYQQLAALLVPATTIMIIQPEKPDGDSLCSALALEQIFGDLGKTVVLYAKDPAPNYLSYFEGADRLTDEFPNHFDLTILVDAGGPTQIDRTLEKHQGALSSKPFVIIDHHSVRDALPFPTIDFIDNTAAATGEYLTQIATELNWPINAHAAALLTPAIMADTLGLTTTGTTAETIDAVALLVRAGANLSQLNDRRLAASALTPELLRLRAKLLLDAKFELDGRLVILDVSPDTLKTYSKDYDPAALVFFDLLHVKEVLLVAIIKDYGTKVKLSMRAKAPIAGRIAEQLGGGGHAHAAAAGLASGQVEHIRTTVRAMTKEYLADATK
jgi:phosphoesterase RecJ-like protein